MKFLARISLAVALFAATVLPGFAQTAYFGTNKFRTTQVTVTAAATLVVGPVPTRLRVQIATLGTVQVYCGPDNTVTSATGYPINPVASIGVITVETTASVWCIAASSQAVAASEVYN